MEVDEEEKNIVRDDHNRENEANPTPATSDPDALECISPQHGNNPMYQFKKSAHKGMSEVGLLKGKDKLMSALIITEVVHYEDIMDSIKALFGDKNPVSSLMEFSKYLQAAVTFQSIGQQTGPLHRPRFTMVAMVAGEPFMRVEACSKKEARSGAAYLAWKALLHREKQKFQTVLDDKSALWADLVAARVHYDYLQLVDGEPGSFCGKKVLSGIILKRKDNMKVVALGTGSRCVSGGGLSMDGTVVNDCHAEVIARRAFIRYLYSEVKKYHEHGPHRSIFECSPQGLLRVVRGVSFHMYISTLPCGDASVFSKSCEGSNEMMLDSKVHGLLRTKIEAGEGAPPVVRERCQVTWLGLTFGQQRLRLMSCSDKLCTWNVLGLQGALLTHFIHPIYLTSLTIGGLSSSAHVRRALGERLISTNLPYSWPAPYSLHLPSLYGSTLMTDRKDGSATISVVWCEGMSQAQVLDGRKGVPDANRSCGQQQLRAVVCKKELYVIFRQLATKQQCRQLMKLSNYHCAKQEAHQYQAAKKAVRMRFQVLGCGQWQQLPEELQYFS